MKATKGKDSHKSQSLAGSESSIQQVQGTRSVHDLNEAEQTTINSLLKTSKEIAKEADRLYDEGIYEQNEILKSESTKEYINFNKKKWLPADEVRKVIHKEIAKNKKYFHKKKDVSRYPELLPKILEEREFCSLCMEDDYCSHEIKIETLNKLKERLGFK